MNKDVLDIFNETLAIYFKNINFIIFTLLTSLPFFFLMVYFETLFQQTLVQTPNIISNLPFQERNRLRFYSIVDHKFIYNGPSFSKDYLPLLIQLGFIYTIPLHFLEFCSKVFNYGFSFKAYQFRRKHQNESQTHVSKFNWCVNYERNIYHFSVYTCIIKLSSYCISMDCKQLFHFY